MRQNQVVSFSEVEVLKRKYYNYLFINIRDYEYIQRNLVL